MTRLPFLVFLSLCAIAAAGCGQTADPPASSPPGADASPTASPPLPAADASAGDDAAAHDAAVIGPIEVMSAADFCPSVKTICSFLTTCAPEAMDGMWGAPGECETSLNDSCIASYPLGAQVRADDAKAFAACASALTCDAMYGPRWTTACVVPRLASTKVLGTACRSDFECESNACTGSSTQCGTCVERVAAGQECTDRAQCPRGGACSGVACIALASLNDACDPHNVCGNGLVCTAGKCLKAGGEGASCTSDSNCDLPAMVRCNRATSKCEKATFAQPGEPCPASSADGPPVACMKGSRCIRPVPGEAGTCVAPAKVGEACGSTKPCESFTNCRGGTCVLPTYAACP